MNERLKKLRLAKKSITKQSGANSVGMAVNLHRDLPRLKTGSLSMDRALGGGIPIGKATIFNGTESSAKTTTMYRIAGLAQNICANCYREVDDLEVVEDIDDETGEVEYVAVATCDCYNKGIFVPRQLNGEKTDEFKARLKRYTENSYEEYRVALFDVEGDMDTDWAQCQGMDIRRLIYSRTDTMEEAIDTYDEVLRTGSVDLILLDSIALMAPSEEVEKSANESQMGLQARLMGKFTRKLAATNNSAIKDFGRTPTHIWINQLRQKIGGYGGSVMPAGRSQLFFASVIIKFWQTKGDVENVNEGMIAEHKQERLTGIVVNFKVDKNKTHTQGFTGSYRLCVTGENKGKVDELKFVLAQAEKFGLYRTDGAGSKKRWFIGDEEYSKKSDAMARITDPDVLKEMTRVLLSKMIG